MFKNNLELSIRGKVAALESLDHKGEAPNGPSHLSCSANGSHTTIKQRSPSFLMVIFELIVFKGYLALIFYEKLTRIIQH